jgi:hypothetical protein
MKITILLGFRAVSLLLDDWKIIFLRISCQDENIKLRKRKRYIVIIIFLSQTIQMLSR